MTSSIRLCLLAVTCLTLSVFVNNVSANSKQLLGYILDSKGFGIPDLHDKVPCDCPKQSGWKWGHWGGKGWGWQFGVHQVSPLIVEMCVT